MYVCTYILSYGCVNYDWSNPNPAYVICGKKVIIACFFSYFIVVSAQVVNSSAASDIVFPTNPDELANFTAVDMNNAAQITIPAEAITQLAAHKDSTDG